MLRTTSESNCWWFGRNGIVCMAHTPCPSGCRAPAPILTFADRLDNSGTAMWFQTSVRSCGTREGLGQKNKGTGVLLFSGYITGPNRQRLVAFAAPRQATEVSSVGQVRLSRGLEDECSVERSRHG